MSSKNYAYKDIRGKKFDSLRAIYPTDKRDRKGSVIWHCICDCGSEIDVSYNCLAYSPMKSCGCLKRKHDRELGSILTHIDGTSIDMLRSKKIPSDNTTGYRGVYLIRGKYVAKIVFQQKQYQLGTFKNIEDAVKARSEAEKLLFDSTSDFYSRWKSKADENPEWGKLNPISIKVFKDFNGLNVEFLPRI